MRPGEAARIQDLEYRLDQLRVELWTAHNEIVEALKTTPPRPFRRTPLNILALRGKMMRLRGEIAGTQAKLEATIRWANIGRRARFLRTGQEDDP